MKTLRHTVSQSKNQYAASSEFSAFADAFDLEPRPQIEQLFPVKCQSYFVGMTDESAKTIRQFHVPVQ
jgi:hypothetical protein